MPSSPPPRNPLATWSPSCHVASSSWPITLASPRMIMSLSERHEWPFSTPVRNDNDAGCVPKALPASTLTLLRFSEGGGEVLLCSHEKKDNHSQECCLAVISVDLVGGVNRTWVRMKSKPCYWAAVTKRKITTTVAFVIFECKFSIKGCRRG